LGKTLVILGLGLALIGALVLLLEKAGISLGQLPGDLRIEGKRGGFYFPIVTCIVLSVLLSLLLNLLGKK
jgi:hypothetical protein